MILGLGATAEFQLDGHDCPLGIYPSLVVPIGMAGKQLYVVYTGAGEAEFRPIHGRATYVRHNERTATALRRFDPRRHGLFALSRAELLMYELESESEFYSRLLESSVAFSIELFYRLSLSFETSRLSLIKPLYFRCLDQLHRTVPEFIEQWSRAVERYYPPSLFFYEQWLRTLSGSTGTSVAGKRPAEALSSFQMERNDAFLADMSRETVSRALSKTFAPTSIVDEGTERWLYAALTTSISPERFLMVSMSTEVTAETRRALPTALEVATKSGLTLPYLEFNWVILNKHTAAEFLQRSGIGLPQHVLRSEILTRDAYVQHFGRRPTRVGRRMLFTYAEALSLVGYRGELELPTGLRER